MLKEEKKYYLIAKNKLYESDNKNYMIELIKPYKELEFTKQDYIDALTNFFYGEEEKITKSMKKLIQKEFNELNKNYVMIIQTIKENEKKFRYISNRVVEIEFIKWWE